MSGSASVGEREKEREKKRGGGREGGSHIGAPETSASLTMLRSFFFFFFAFPPLFVSCAGRGTAPSLRASASTDAESDPNTVWKEYIHTCNTLKWKNNIDFILFTPYARTV